MTMVHQHSGNKTLTDILRSIFKPNDGSRQKILAEVTASREMVEEKANRFEGTIRELLERNDVLTGRSKHHEHPEP